MQNDLTKELGTNFIEYAVAVNTDRAIPNAKDGLKPVAKRILWGALDKTKCISSKPHIKAAKLVGDIMGTYHPHGDSSIYGALVRLSQKWVMRYPLIDFHGNNGNIIGDGPAHMRYTECRLSKLTEEGLLQGTKKNNVDFIDNYDETTQEPVSLPSIFPNLLCNPNSGIGVAMACSWAPHNLNEVASAINQYLIGEEPILPGPDFPTGGIIINKDDIPAIMKTGHGSVKIRSKFEIDKQNIIFTEIPYGTSVEGLIAEIGKVADNKEVEGIDNIRDDSNKKGIRIVIECDKNIDPNSIINKLFTKTNLQSSFSYNQVALIDKVPTELNLKDCIKIYVDHNIDCIIRETTFDRQKAIDRLEIVNGLLKALEDIDNIIILIKKSDNAAAAKETLITSYDFTENQAKAILAMRLSSLAKLESIELNKEAKELAQKIDELHEILCNKNKQIEILQSRLSALVKKYGDSRRTELVQLETNIEKTEIVPEDVIVIINHNGDIKRVPKQNFKLQHRKGVGIKSLDKAILKVISTNTLDTLMIFTSKGKMYRLSVEKVPIGTNTSKGINLKTLLPLASDEEVQTATNAIEEENTNNVVFFTKKGLIKKTLFENYSSMKKTTGIQAIKIKEKDELLSVTFMEEEDVFLVTKFGNIIHIPTNDIKPIGRLTSGVKGINLKDGDEVISAFPLRPQFSNIIIATAKGKGKRLPINSLILQNRGGRGTSCIKLDPGDYVAAAAETKLDSSILVLGQPNSICIPANEISEQTKAGSGVKIIERSEIKAIIRI